MQKGTTTTVKQLKDAEFIQVKNFSHLYINQSGNVHNLKTGKYLKPNGKNYIRTESKYLSVPKMILEAFAGQKYRDGQTVYIDGNKSNLTPLNLKYARLFEPSRTYEVNQTDLMSAIRCYFEVEKRYNVKNTLQTRLYLQMITEKRRFLVNKNGLQYFQVYKTYLKGLTNNLLTTAKEHDLTVLDCAIIVNDFTNVLIDEILNDLKTRHLFLYDYKPKQPTETDKIKEWNEHTKASGQKPIPLRKQSLKESLKEFKSRLSDSKETR